MDPVRDIAIIGGGLSGALLTMRLLEAPQPPRIHLIDADGTFGRGLAYGADHRGHFLNVRAGRMSVFPGQPDHFAQWASAHEPGAAAQDWFIDRARYGDYVAEQLHAAVQKRPGAVQFIQDRVTDIVQRDGKVRVSLAQGAPVEADAAVLALGNQPSLIPLPFEHLAHAGDPRLIADPWRREEIDRIGAQEDVLLLGASLTMVDVALTLARRGHKGKLIALSRRGLLPHAHESAVIAHGAGQKPSIAPLSRMLRNARRTAEALSAKGESWQALMDDIRPYTPEVWESLPHKDRARFLRHLRPFWDIHRHRLAPHVNAQLQTLLSSGQLRVMAGRVTDVRSNADAVSVKVALRGVKKEVALHVSRIINCTGPCASIRHTPNSLIAYLLKAGLLRPHASGIGFDVDAEGRLISASGDVQPRLFALGPLTQGAFWECTAAPEIRARSARLAQLLASFGPQQCGAVAARHVAPAA